MSDLKTVRRIQSIHLVLGGKEDLLMFFFHHKKAELRLEANELLTEARLLNRSDKVLIGVAVDLWTSKTKIRLGALLKILDDEKLINIVSAVLYHREIDADYLVNEYQC